jgi:tetratricopeptide (TPR) repeat protein
MTKPPAPNTVFLSYARADDHPDYDDAAKSFMRRLYTALTAEGFDVWWDRASLPSRGEEFTVEIERAIRGCERFVLVCGPGAAESDYVRAEWHFALAECKPVTPILRAGDYAMIPPEVAGVNAIDCRPERDEAAAFRDIAARLRQDAPLGVTVGVKRLPDAYVNRDAPFGQARHALMADAIQTTVISAPPRETTRSVGTQRAVAVYGLGGIGKSTLAAALAEDCAVRRHFADGVIWLEVGQTPTVAGLQASVGVHFGDSRDNYQDDRDGALSLSRLLKDKRALLVLDDVWDHGLVERFPVTGTACRLLITTRSGALASRVQGADVKLGLLSPGEGARLMAARAGGSADDPDYKAITALLGGHTLAVALAANQIAEGYAESAAEMLRLLGKRAEGGEPFKDLAVDEDDKDLNLARSLSLSYDNLKPDDLKRRFRATGVFALEGTFDLAALAAVWGDADPDDARGPLMKLVGAGLLDEAALAEGGERRYSQHRLLRAYARALLHDPKEAEAGEFAQVVARHFAHYAALHGDYDANGDEDRHPLILADFENLRAALDWGNRHTVEGAVDLAWALDYFMMMRESHAVRGEVLMSARVAAQAARYARGEANTLRALGDLMLRRADLDAAQGYYDAALPQYRAIGARLGEANTLQALGDLMVRLDELDAAKGYYDAALPQYRAIGARLGEANTLRALGALMVRLDELDAAKGYYDAALPQYRAIGARLGEANTLKALGDLMVRLDELDAAKAQYLGALQIYEAIGARPSQGNCWYGLAQVAETASQPQDADQYYCRALTIQYQLVQVHPSFGRVFNSWRRKHNEMLVRFGIQSACDGAFPPL